ncbi:raffinose/stachyose/melibiose transport system permease protein [Pullulanibacillus pueri]|uniref:Putative ABC transporter permease protein AmyC n=1 Tax=Pullulanibacillus pueri TaxID=1437324 RepID=A0A8J2ZRF2_9BACL|nr:carbohydrate ABC transporter permease [Pullulanibacillus pueri]MBM7679966.1 raffinose/stachyose/melibiose transport system permease protein [Pullulanibacillus pueri]GGH73709.1 putative ABC transporter permease protein AmyC [Pullulanibacillus pueri]
MSKSAKGVMTGLSILIALVHIVPFYILITMSLKKTADFSSRWAFPKYFQLDNFSEAWKQVDLGHAFFNTFTITLFAALLLIFVGSLAAYPLARRETKLNKIVYVCFVAIMVIPPLTALVPLYNMVVSIGMINTRTIAVLNNVASFLPLTIFLYGGFIKSTIPRELEEAARIDGASIMGIFFRVVFPLLKPITATILILCCVYVWNDYQFAIFFLQDASVRTVTVALASFFGENTNNLNLVAAAALIAILPMAILFLVLQKYFIRGLAAGAIKG